MAFIWFSYGDFFFILMHEPLSDCKRFPPAGGRPQPAVGRPKAGRRPAGCRPQPAEGRPSTAAESSRFDGLDYGLNFARDVRRSPQRLANMRTNVSRFPAKRQEKRCAGGGDYFTKRSANGDWITFEKQVRRAAARRAGPLRRRRRCRRRGVQVENTTLNYARVRSGIARDDGFDRDAWNPIDKAWARVSPHVASPAIDAMLDGAYDTEQVRLRAEQSAPRFRRRRRRRARAAL